MKYLKEFLLAVLAGIAISIGGAVFLSVNGGIAGALLFTVGLFSVVTCGFFLYTGKIGYVVVKPPQYLLTLLVTWLGNLAGTLMTGYVLRSTRMANTMVPFAAEISQKKLADGPLSILILSIFCGMLMYLAVDGYQTIPHGFAKVMALLFGVGTFILCGFEHCVANMFYFSIAHVWSLHALWYVVIMTVGNSIGAILIALGKQLNKIGNNGGNTPESNAPKG